jgi:hypothetical protein
VKRILIADAGPLFSLAAANILPALLHFPLSITDVVKGETIDKGRLRGASPEAVALHRFYQEHRARIEIRETQFGVLLAAAKRGNPKAKTRNAGELSIQSLLIELSQGPGTWEAAVLFEDAWFTRHAVSFPPHCRLIGTTAFLRILEALGLIPSTQDALARIRQRRAIRERR